MSRAFIGLGSNLGDRERAIRLAIEQLRTIPGTKVVGVSSLYDSDAAGDPTAPDYLNAVAELDTDRAPRPLLWHLLLIEARMGRTRRVRNAPRPIDLDLLLHDQRIINEPDFVLPHPRLTERPFVLVPLEELDPDLIHPVERVSIRRLLREGRFEGGVRWIGRL
jgi:2-amino-4-hydroxy-6-hydroxymethyldihydropteridine diphosphokinase